MLQLTTSGDSTHVSLLPRAPRQVHDLSFQVADKQPDQLKELLMLQASESDEHNYIKKVTVTKWNTSTLLFLDEQSNFLRGFFGLYSSETQPFTFVDTTFNLSNYYALVTSVKCDLFVGDPLLLGPILLTKRQRSGDYGELWYEIARRFANFDGAEIVCVTDGEESLMKAIRDHLPNTTFLRCSQHLIDNARRKALEFGLPRKLIATIVKSMKDQFLLHWATFDDEQRRLIDEWRTPAATYGCDTALAKFLSYYEKKITPVIASNLVTRYPTFGLTSPITNHCAESMNAAIKRCTGENNKLCDLVASLKDFSKSQSNELRNGLLGKSQKYILKTAFTAPTDDVAETLPGERYMLIFSLKC